jgi:hypothetical protein
MNYQSTPDDGMKDELEGKFREEDAHSAPPSKGAHPEY